ncbi:hypothetical protein [Bradyrhizobium sp. 1(2017)]|uniref:hypothetical protein n=1 Tax=Bradyrhizobium sp. 1(2017) TaxID=1404888 RepID=UPI00140F2864|nr:hypothetical protein [Bradyrhizobium sp. 1(2017)]QIO36934.1 hypothetical protein HAP40_36580 [Bradyrhizobium sp. 1(2017)]
MTVAQPIDFSRILSWLALALAAVLLALGAYRYGWSVEIHRRFWADIFERVHGPMSFRFYLQPTMALIAAVPDGIRDTRLGHKSFFWSAWWDRSAPAGRLREGLASIARVMLLGISMDVIYQFKALDRFYPVEALMMALLLAVIPYFVFRWIVERVASWWLGRKEGA